MIVIIIDNNDYFGWKQIVYIEHIILKIIFKNKVK